MKRRLFTIIAFISALLATATLLLWINSYRVNDTIIRHHVEPTDYGEFERGLALASSHGDVAVEYWWHWHIFYGDATTRPLSASNNSIKNTWEHVTLRPNPYSLHHGFKFVGIQFEHQREGYGAHWTIIIPLLLPLVLFSLLCLFGFILHRRQYKTRPGLFCASCGYDLRATPDHCPECGTISKMPPRI